MRGAITLAAAQTLPAAAPDRAFLVLVAFVVAALSLLVQGGTLAMFVSWIKPAGPDVESQNAQRAELLAMLTAIEQEIRAANPPVVETPTDTAVDAVLPPSRAFAARKRLTIEIIDAQRTALLDARDDGTFDADVLNNALDNLDADEISIELKGAPVER